MPIVGSPQPAADSIPDFGADWLFGGRYLPGAAAPDYDDALFEPITLPHCVVDLSWNGWDPAAWDGEWIYRRHLRPPEEWRGRRIFCEFEGVLSSSTVVVNGTELGRHQGGYLPFSYELTDVLHDGDNVIAVIVDGSWQQVPPDGHPKGPAAVDYCQPAGIYREVQLQARPETFIADVFARPVNVLTKDRRVELTIEIDAGSVPASPTELSVELVDGERIVATTTVDVRIDEPGATTVTATLQDLAEIDLWHVDHPQLYDVVTRLGVDGEEHHHHRTRIGFREARWENDGFFLNGERLHIFGLNRHQIYPYRGHAMPSRAQRRDAEILKQDFNCNMVRCAHYPPSRHFLDACDELGLLVWEEPPGWQYLPDDPSWLSLALRDVGEMVRRDRNRPAIVLWSARLNETRNLPHFYQRTKDLINTLDGSRQTTGAMIFHSTEDWVQDVFGFDDYSGDGVNAFLRPPLEVPYLVSETVGALSSRPLYRWLDRPGVLAQQAIAHAEVHDAGRADDGYAGVTAWLAFDYGSQHGNTYKNVKTPGVADLFRVPKFAGLFYRSQADPSVRPVIEPAFVWGGGPDLPPQGPGQRAVILSNCDRLEIHLDGVHTSTAYPDRQGFPHLDHPPYSLHLRCDPHALPELRIDGYLGDTLVATRRMAADPAHDHLELVADDHELTADGVDLTRLVFRTVDEFGNWRRTADGEVRCVVDGPGTLIGDNPFEFADSPGVGAVWLRTSRRPGRVTVTAAHPRLGAAQQVITTLPQEYSQR